MNGMGSTLMKTCIHLDKHTQPWEA